jgi:hypothetical protein
MRAHNQNRVVARGQDHVQRMVVFMGGLWHLAGIGPQTLQITRTCYTTFVGLLNHNLQARAQSELKAKLDVNKLSDRSVAHSSHFKIVTDFTLVQVGFQVAVHAPFHSFIFPRG